MRWQINNAMPERTRSVPVGKFFHQTFQAKASSSHFAIMDWRKLTGGMPWDR
jgi:hypothetical protein